MNSKTAFEPIKIALSTVGSTGDIQPFLVLGKTLMERGHDVIAISHKFHQERFERYGIPFFGCGPNVSQDELNELLDRMMALRNPLKQLKTLLNEAILADGKSYFEEAKQAMTGRQLVISHMIDFLGQAAAKSSNIPTIGVVFTHSIIPTPVSSPALVPNIRILNPLTWKLMTWMMRPLDKNIQSFLHSIGAPELKIKRYASLGSLGTIVAASEELAAVPSKFLPQNVVCTGPWSMREGKEKPDPSLEAFLSRHPNPVVVSLGSMGGNNGPELTSKILESLKICNLPAVIQSGYAGLHADTKDERFQFTGFVSHEYLFPKAKMVIHHGGAGTTAAACRAGVPSVVIAFIADQPYFGTVLKKAGLAPPFIWHNKLTAKLLAKRIQAAESPKIQARAKELQSIFEREVGADGAAAWIEQRFQSYQQEKS